MAPDTTSLAAPGATPIPTFPVTAIVPETETEVLIVKAEVKVTKPETKRELATETEDWKVTPEVNVDKPETPNDPETETDPRS